MKKTTSSNTIHSRVKEELLTSIRFMPIGARLPAERQLCGQFGISRMTMNKVIKELEEEGYLSRKVGAGTYVMPRPQPVAQIAANSSSRGEIIIVYPDFYSYSIWKRVHLLELMAMRENLRLISMKMYPESNWDSLYELVSACRNLRGLIIIAAFPIVRELERLDAIGCPVVILGELSETYLSENLFCISRNHYQSGFLKMNALLEAGHRKLGWIPNEPPTLAGQCMLDGMKSALYRYKLRYQDLARPSERIDYWDSPMHSGYLQTLEVMKAHPDCTGLAVDTFTGAVGALRALRELGLTCPDQVSIGTAGEDNELEQYLVPAITSVIEPYDVTIKTALNIINDRGSVSSRTLRIDVKLITRESIKNMDVTVK